MDPTDYDAARFETLSAAGRRLLAEERPAEARDALDGALGLWRGPALAEFVFEPWAEVEANRLEELKAVAIEDRMEADLHLGKHCETIAALEAAVAERPLRERRWELLLLGLYRAGRQGEALRAFSRVRSHLGEQLGIEPGRTLRRLEADILAQSPRLDLPPAVQHKLGFRQELLRRAVAEAQEVVSLRTMGPLLPDLILSADRPN